MLMLPEQISNEPKLMVPFFTGRTCQRNSYLMQLVPLPLVLMEQPKEGD